MKELKALQEGINAAAPNAHQKIDNIGHLYSAERISQLEQTPLEEQRFYGLVLQKGLREQLATINNKRDTITKRADELTAKLGGLTFASEQSNKMLGELTVIKTKTATEHLLDAKQALAELKALNMEYEKQMGYFRENWLHFQNKTAENPTVPSLNITRVTLEKEATALAVLEKQIAQANVRYIDAEEKLNKQKTIPPYEKQEQKNVRRAYDIFMQNMNGKGLSLQHQLMAVKLKDLKFAELLRNFHPGEGGVMNDAVLDEMRKLHKQIRNDLEDLRKSIDQHNRNKTSPTDKHLITQISVDVEVMAKSLKPGKDKVNSYERVIKRCDERLHPPVPKTAPLPQPPAKP